MEGRLWLIVTDREGWKLTYLNVRNVRKKIGGKVDKPSTDNGFSNVISSFIKKKKQKNFISSSVHWNHGRKETHKHNSGY